LGRALLKRKVYFAFDFDDLMRTNNGFATYRAYFTEMSARLLLQARQLDGPITFLDAEEAAKINELRQAGYIRQWELWKRELAGK
jgi:hypothetical protein